MSAVRVAQYRCANERRRELVRASTVLNGIDAVEVDASQTVLRVQFLHDLPGSGPDAVPPSNDPLGAEHVVVAGGRRERDVEVVGVQTDGAVLTVTVDRPGDFSPYELRLVDPLADDDVPAGFDTQLARVVFSFKASCESELDCLPVPCAAPAAAAGPLLDYLTKDYEGFRRLMLDRMAATMVGFREPNPADIQVMLVELLAYVADHLSYYQDAVATEAYLGTARRRVSVRRHARMLDYHVHEGCSARTFVHFEATTGLTVPAGHAVATGASHAEDDDSVVFETLHPVGVRPAHNELVFHTWGDEQCCLPAGATRASLVGAAGVALAPGDFLLLEEIGHPTEPDGQADPTHRHVVRLTEVTPTLDRLDGTAVLEVIWDPDDALAAPLCLSAEGRVTAVARANLALADHGATLDGLGLPSEHPEPPGPWRPLVPSTPLAFTVPFDPARPASRQLDVDPRRAVAAITMSHPDDSEIWEPVPDLLSAAPTATAFVVEVEDDGQARLRFGDDTAGRRPARGTAFLATARIGGGRTGNVVAGALNRSLAPLDGISSVRNPLAAAGGTDPEPTELVRQLAPHVYRTQERAVTEQDYAAMTDRLASVQRSSAQLRWTGSWYTAFVTVDPVGGGAPDAELAGEIETHLDSYRMAGVDVEIDGPVPVPLDIGLEVCVASGHLGAQVEARVLDALSSTRRPDGSLGFFHPDRFTFGQPLHLSELYAAVLAVTGVQWVRATTFRRFGRPDAGELADGVVRVRGREVLQVSGDPSLPDHGRLTITTAGGS